MEAWGPDLASCLEEAVAALVGACADVTGAPVVGTHVVHLPRAPADAVLVDLLDEVVFVLDTAGTVPIGAAIRAAAGGGLDVTLSLAALSSVEPTGAVPKAISRSDLRVETRPGEVRCAFLVDV